MRDLQSNSLARSDLNSITVDRAKQIRDMLSEAAGFESLINRSDPSPWCGVELRDAQAAQHALDLVSRVAHEELPSLIASLTQISASSQLICRPIRRNRVRSSSSLALSNDILSHYQKEVFSEAQSLADEMRRGYAGRFGGFWARLTDRNFKKARKAAVLRMSGKATGEQIWEEIKSAISASEFWRAWSKRTSRQPSKIWNRVNGNTTRYGRAWVMLTAS